MRAAGSSTPSHSHRIASHFPRRGKILSSFWKVGGINSACCIRAKLISLRSLEDSEPKQTHERRVPSPVCCEDGEALRGYVPTELVATYRELVRLHSQ